MNHIKVNLVFISVILLLVGCNTVSKLGRSDEYRKAKPHDQSLVLPSDINNGMIKNDYPMPNKRCNNQKTPSDLSLIVPPGCKL